MLILYLPTVREEPLPVKLSEKKRSTRRTLVSWIGSQVRSSGREPLSPIRTNRQNDLHDTSREHDILMVPISGKGIALRLSCHR